MRRMLLVLMLLTLSTVPAAQAPQRGQGEPPTISVETNLVMLPVTVLARHGEFVTDLTADRFVVYDNGEPQPIEFFSSEEMPATVGLVIDSSSSMRVRRPDVTAAATAFASSAHPLDEMFSVNFNEQVWTGLPQGVPFADSVAQLHRALARAPAVGMTALYDAVDLALEHLQLGTRDRRALIVVSDGGDNASNRTLDEVLEHARRANVVIYAVLLADPSGHDAKPAVLRKLTKDTGGALVEPRRSEDVMSAFERIGQDIRSGYMLGYSPSAADNGGFRTIKVVATSRDGRPLTVRTRAGYYAGHSHGTR